MTTNPDSAAEFLPSRANWLRVETVDYPGGGWDVVLRLDGTYYLDGTDDCFGGKAEMVRFFQERLLEVFQAEGIPPRELKDWARPAEREARS